MTLVRSYTASQLFTQIMSTYWFSCFPHLSTNFWCKTEWSLGTGYVGGTMSMCGQRQYTFPLHHYLKDLHYHYCDRLSAMLYASIDTKARWCIKNSCLWESVSNVSSSIVPWWKIQFDQFSASYCRTLIYMENKDRWELVMGTLRRGLVWSIWTIYSSLNFRTVA